MSTFLLDIVTPQKLAFSGQVEAVYAPTPDGTIGILPHHMPLFTALSEGEVKILTSDKEYYLAIGGGFMDVAKDKTILLVSRAVHADEINEEEIKKAQAAAKEIINRVKKGDEYDDAQAILRRSLIEFKLLRRKSNRPISQPLNS